MWGTVTLAPGANVEQTPTLLKAGYAETQNLRFKAGLAQKLGGWTKYVSAAFSGTIRSLWAWQDINTDKRLSVASTGGVTVVREGQFTDLTPQELESDFAPDFSSTLGSVQIEVVDTNLTGITDDVVVEFATPVSVGGVVLSGTYPIALVTGSNSYIIEAWTQATATEANAGMVPIFTTTNGSSSVSVELADHGQLVGNTVIFAIATAVGGLTISGRYTVSEVSDADNFIVIADGLANASATSAMNGGDARIIYHIAKGPEPSGFGYGLGDYCEGAYGLGTSSGGISGNPITATDWTQDNWGEILIACPEGGGIYYWQPGTGFESLALIPEGPLFNDGAFISMAQQQVIAWGSTVDARLGGGIGVYQDPLLIRWCDIGNFLQWDQLPENFAREFRIPTGSRCVAGAAGKNRNLVWTDIALHAGTFNGGDSVYSWNQVGANCGIVGKHAWAQHADTVYWMGVGNFFAYSGGGVEVIPCPVWDAVFDRIPSELRHRVVAGCNSDFTEIWWWFPTTTGGDDVAGVVKYNITEGTWDFDGPVRCAWLDRSVLGNPIGASLTGIVYSHESGFDDDTQALMAGFETGDFYLSEGEEFTFVDQVWPDFKWGRFAGPETAQINFTLLCRDAPGETPREFGPFTVTKASPFFEPETPEGIRPRCRQMALRIESSDVGSFWRLGAVRFRYSPDGRFA